ncbi:UBX domain-containing protein 11 isoform 3-T3 [Molossus nigricans]
MSSPLASLGKTRRVPLPSEPVNSGRRGIKLYGDGPVFHDSELMATMARKVQDLERQVKAQTDEMLSKDRKIRALEELVETLQEHKGQMSQQRQEELEAMCTQLQQQISEMERFLGDYGLQWVGEPMDEEDSEDITGSENDKRDWMTAKKFWKPGDSLVPPEVDFDRLLASLKDLSELVDSNTQVTPIPGRAKLHVLEPIPLKVYRNGIMMFDGPFRPFHDPSTQHCLRDIMDGFFPSELQRLYPDGVPFKGFTFLICKVGLQQATPWACSWNLSNRGGGGARAEELVLPLSPFLLCQVSDLRNQVYPESGLDPFPGEGRVVGWQRIRKPSVTMEHPGSRMTPEKFLNRLPKFVIRQGEVIDIRGPIRNTLQNCCPWPVPIQEIVVETPALAAERERNQESPESPAPPLSMLRIKSENGEQAFLLMMRPEDTVGDVRALLAQARSVWGQAGSCSGSLVPRPDLILSARSSGLWTQTPSRSSVHSRPQSTMRTHSRCRLLDWCPMQLCYCGQAGLCHLPPDPNLPPIRIKHLPPTLAAS